MMSLSFRAACVSIVATAVACGSPADAPMDGPQRSDSGVPVDAAPDGSATPDAAPDAMIDAPQIVDVDGDGHPAELDCNDADPAVWQQLAYSFRDADGDGHTIAATGTICSGARLPPGYAAAAGEADCDDGDPAAFATIAGYVDADGDGAGTGALVTFCNAGVLPTGYAATGGDCAADDATHLVLRAYSFRDVDGDGAAVAEVGAVCSGAALPSGYFATAPVGRPLDCDDADPGVSVALTVFVDADLDGVGVAPAQLACTNGTAPLGFSLTSSDCDDANRDIWASLLYLAVDFDGDGFTTPSMGTRCTAGSLAPPYYAAPVGNDCNDADAAHWAWLSYVAIDTDGDGATTPASGQRCTDGVLPAPYRATASGNDCDDGNATLTHFAVLYPDLDGDGVGSSPRQVRCLGETTPAGLVSGGYDEDDTNPAVIETEEFDELIDLIVLGG